MTQLRNFPIPYEDELLYSAIARAGIYSGIRSAKFLAREIFGKEGMTATFDLPSRVGRINTLLLATKKYTAESLIYDHTLFPLYAPFVQERKRSLALRRMTNDTNGSVHLMLGVAASRVKSVQTLRYCAKCVELQLNLLGESYWRRDWFLPSIPYCYIHGPLSLLELRKTHHKHNFIPCTPAKVAHHNIVAENKILTAIATMSQSLMRHSPMTSPGTEQWTQFYSEVAQDNGLSVGKRTKHADVLEAITECIGSDTLRLLNLVPDRNKGSDWLTSIFRKQRKSFSYLEHLIVWKTFLPYEEPQGILDRISRIKISRKFVGLPKIGDSPQEIRVENAVLKERRATWGDLVKDHGVKGARSYQTGGALYAWLYRNDNQWLMGFNASHTAKKQKRAPVVDWHARDRLIVRNLIRIRRGLAQRGYRVRRSSNWYLNQLQNHKESIAKNLPRFSLTQMFLTKYSESVSQYQIRRLCKVFVDKLWYERPIIKWEILKEAGISERTMTLETRVFAGKLKLDV